MSDLVSKVDLRSEATPENEFVGTLFGFPVFVRRSMPEDQIRLSGRRQAVVLDLSTGQVAVVEP